MARIPLVNDRGCAIVDDNPKLIERLRERGPWYWHEGYARSGPDEDGKRVLMHRFIIGPLPGIQIDHVNGERLDNRLGNLRVATAGENQANRRGPQSNNSHGGLGVWQARDGRWRARVRGRYARHADGTTYFPTQQAAMDARDKLAARVYGAFATLNGEA